jgi:hypothetical protein
MLVSEEELAPPVAGKPPFERFRIPVERHIFSICDIVADDVSPIR